MSSNPVFRVKSSVTIRNQTTIPSAVRQALALKSPDKIVFEIGPGGTVTVARVAHPKKRRVAEMGGGNRAKGDPVIARFLDFIEADMRANPGSLRALTSARRARARALLKGVEADRNSPLDPADE